MRSRPVSWLALLLIVILPLASSWSGSATRAADPPALAPVTWADALRLPPVRPPAPTPSEPDDGGPSGGGGGPFHAAAVPSAAAQAAVERPTDRPDPPPAPAAPTPTRLARASGGVAPPLDERPDPPAGGAPAYQLADATGQVWTHPDLAWLRTYVASRNATLVTPPVVLAPLVQAPGGCPGGNCFSPASFGLFGRWR